MKRRAVLSLALLLFCLPGLVHAGPDWMRYPAISPDGSQIVFSFQGDLYRVPSAGGAAFPLTLDEAYDFMPVWSRDGSTLAFASDRHGNFDVYTMPAQGGPATRRTFDSADDLPSDFRPDGSAVLFSSSRLDTPELSQFPSGMFSELYEVALDGSAPQQIVSWAMPGARFDSSGKRIVFHDIKGYEDRWRKHHRSSVTRDLWTYEPAGGSFTRLTEDSMEQRNPWFEPDGSIVYLGDESGIFNVRRRAADGSTTALTEFDRHAVRFLSRADDGTLCFGFHGGIYTLAPGGKPQQVAIEVRADPAGVAPRDLRQQGGASEVALSPNGKEIAFIVRGEVFATSLETDVTKRVTDTPEQERSIDWSPDGRSIVYASERDGSWNLYRTKLARDEEKYFFRATVLEEEPLLVSDADTFQPSYSPTGDHIAYLESRTTLKVLDVESGESVVALPGDRNVSYADGDFGYAWAPDGRWLLTQFLYPGYWISEIGLVSADGKGEVKNLTESGYFDVSPRWALKGKAFTWASNRDGLQGHAKTGPSEYDIYAAFLDREAWDRFRLTEEELELLEEAEKEEESEEEEGEGDAGNDDKDGKKDKKSRKKKDAEKSDEGKSKKDKKKEIDPLELDLEDLRERRARLTIHSSRLSDAAMTPDGEKLLYLARFEKGYNLWVTELRTRETKILTPLGSRGGGSIILDEKGKFAIVAAGGAIHKVTIDSGKSKRISFRGLMELDPIAERKAIFAHAWRQVREKFYKPDLHGAEWDRLREEYAPFLDSITQDRDFAELLGEMLGELNASHTGARYRPTGGGGDSTASLGVFFDRGHSGPGLRIAEVMRHNPIASGKSKLAAGVILEKIDGVPVGAGIPLAPLLNRRAGEYTLLSLRSGDERWEERVKPLSRGQERELLYRRWVESRRQETERLSSGRIGYVHVRGMNDSSYRTVQEEVLGRLATKEAVIVDTRFNGGGDLVDDLSIFLSGQQYMDFIHPDGRVFGMEPSRRWTKPSIVIAGEGNYSDAHCFPWAYRELEIGKIVGMPVPGTCTFVWWERQINGSVIFGVPNLGIKGEDGRYLENLQLEPDIRVENPPADVLAGKDAQLERAVAELLGELGN